MGIFDFLKSKAAQPNVETEQKSGDLIQWNVSGFGRGITPYLSVGANHSGEVVDPYTVLQSTACFSCVKLLSDDIAKLPIGVFINNPDGGWSKAPTHPVARLLRSPNRWQTSFAFWQTMVWNMQLRGNAYAYIARDDAGRPTELIPIPAHRCAMLIGNDGSIFYQFQHKTITDYNLTVTDEDMIHVRHFTLGDGYLGISVTQSGSEALGLELATQKHAANMFGQGTQLGGILKHPGQITEAAAARISESWKNAYSGNRNAFKVAMLEEGVEFQQMSMTAEEAQLIAARDKNAESVCRIFRVPPHKIGLMDRATFGNVEEQNISYVDDTLKPITTAFEQELERKLLFTKERDVLDIKFDLREARKGSVKTQMEAYQIGIQSGIYTRNEVRSWENLPRVEGGDEILQQLNTAPATVAAQLQAPDESADKEPNE